jgi:hypothetical protein
MSPSKAITKKATRKPKFLLTEAQVDALEIHYRNIFRVLLNFLDENFNFSIFSNSNWPMINQHIIEMLMLEDRESFELLVQKILQNMDKLDINNPFVAASYAEAGRTDTKSFGEMLDKITAPTSRNAFGLIHFNAGFLGLGDQFSTLWALRLIALAGKAEKYKEIIDKALNALSLDIDYVLRNSPDFIGFMLYVCLLIRPEDNEELVCRCIDYLIQAQKDDGWWYGTTPGMEKLKDLRSNGFVGYDLLYASRRYPNVLSAAERWLMEAFNLTEELPISLPDSFAYSQKFSHPDVWSEAWIRAIVAAGVYLRMRRPQCGVVKEIITNSILTSNEKESYKQFIIAVKPFLPPQEELFRYQPKLKEFWEIADYENSVFIMRRMGEDVHSRAMLQVILDELTTHGFKGRYVGDQPDYYPSLGENNNLYMRGCKHGIAIFERLIAKGKTQDIPNPNILVEIGFMQGKGARILILFDEDSMKIKPAYKDSKSLHGHKLPPVISGTIYKPFHSGSAELQDLRNEVKKWAIGLKEAMNGAQNEEKDSSS